MSVFLPFWILSSPGNYLFIILFIIIYYKKIGSQHYRAVLVLSNVRHPCLSALSILPDMASFQIHCIVQDGRSNFSYYVHIPVNKKGRKGERHALSLHVLPRNCAYYLHLQLSYTLFQIKLRTAVFTPGIHMPTINYEFFYYSVWEKTELEITVSTISYNLSQVKQNSKEHPYVFAFCTLMWEYLCTNYKNREGFRDPIPVPLFYGWGLRFKEVK